MGRTIPSFRIALEEEISTWKWYRKSLGANSRSLLEGAFDEARNYCSASSNAVRPVRFDAMVMAVVAAHQKKLDETAATIEETRLELQC